MKIGFSSICCPTWDLRTMIEQAILLGYDGIELRGLQGELHLPLHPELAQNHQAVVQACESTRVELVCLACSASFGARNKHEVADHKASVRQYVELAEKLHCPYVRVFTGDVPDGSTRYDTLGRIAQTLSELADFAGTHKVTLLIENSGELAASKDLWFLLDAVSHPALAACWNPLNGLMVNDRSTVAVPRMGRRLGIVHVADATMTDGVIDAFTALGNGHVGVDRLLELLTGIGFDGYVMLDLPKLWDNSLADPETFLPESVKYLKGQLGIERKPLSAYKGDKNQPTFAPKSRAIPVPDRSGNS